MSERTLIAALAATIALGATACLAPMDPARTPVAAVQVTVGTKGAAVDTVAVRGATHVRAVAYAAGGWDIGLGTWTYTSSAPQIAKVDSTGTVQGITPGVAQVIAAAPNGMQGAVTVVVVPSEVTYTINAGQQPTAVAFSTDFTHGYALIAPDSLAVLDALGGFRVGAVALHAAARGVAATADAVYATHPDMDSVSVVSPASNALVKRMWVGAGPTGAVGLANRAYIATRYDQKVVIVDAGRLTLGIPMGGQPVDLALSRDGTRLFATVLRGTQWYVVAVATQYPDTISSFAVPAQPTAIATNADGSMVYVLLGAQGRLLAYGAAASGPAYTQKASATVGTGAGGVGASFGRPYVVVSGEPLLILDAQTLAVDDRMSGVGNGLVSVRPDGLFAFVASPSANLIRVIGL